MTAVDILYPTSQAMELLQSQGREHPAESSRYLCKICSKGFISGRALGGHMRAHIPACKPADVFIDSEFRKSKRPRVSDDRSMEEKDDEEGLDGNRENLIFALQRNPKRTRQFAYWDDSFLCGKDFRSWKSQFPHMNCCCKTYQDRLGDARLEESHKHETQDEKEKRGDSNSEIEIEIDHPSGNLSRFDKWAKEKRFKRSRYALQFNPHEEFVSVTNNEEEDLALCLVKLASGVNTAQNPQFQVGAADPEPGSLEVPNIGSQLPKSMSKKVKFKKINEDASLYDADDEAKKYKCTTCNKVFHSYQALGGHSTSHVKFKGGFTQIEDENESLEEDITDELSTESGSQLPRNFQKPPAKERTKESGAKGRDGTRTIETAAISGKKTPRIHECSICNRGFASGQALGGHKRCHWGTGASDSITTSCGNKETPMLQQQPPGRVELLDLNLPALADDDSDAGNLNNLDGNAVDSHGTSHAQTHSPLSFLSSLMGNHPKQGLLTYNNDSHLSKDDEAESEVGKDIGFGRGCDSEFPARAQSWLQLSGFEDPSRRRTNGHPYQGFAGDHGMNKDGGGEGKHGL